VIDNEKWKIRKNVIMVINFTESVKILGTTLDSALSVNHYEFHTRDFDSMHIP